MAFQVNNIIIWILTFYIQLLCMCVCAIDGETFPRQICCHGFLSPLLFSPVYFPFYCPLLLEGININEFHNVVCTPLLTLERVPTPYCVIISKTVNSQCQPQTISFTSLHSRSVPPKKNAIHSSVHIPECQFQNSFWGYQSSPTDSTKKVLKGYEQNTKRSHFLKSWQETFYTPTFSY